MYFSVHLLEHYPVHTSIQQVHVQCIAAFASVLWPWQKGNGLITLDHKYCRKTMTCITYDRRHSSVCVRNVSCRLSYVRGPLRGSGHPEA